MAKPYTRRRTPIPPLYHNPTVRSADYHLLWGVALILAGILIGYFWLWGNAVQIQTSEAWILGTRDGLNLSPRLDLFLQITQFWGGTLSIHEMIAYTWGWLNQIILLAFSLGIELQFGGKERASAFKWGCIFFIILNSLADLNYGNAFGGTWQPWAFAGICFMASFFFGLAAIGLFVEGVKRLIGH